MKKRLFLYNVIMLALAFLLVCGTADSGRAGNRPILRFAYQDRIGSVIPLIAIKKGLFAAEGLEVEPLRFNNGPACAEALFTGAADMGDMGDTAAILMTVRNPKFVILGSLATGEHRHRIMVRNDSTAQSLQDLQGKRLGIKKGTSTHGGLLTLLDRSGISPSEVSLIDLDPPAMMEALQAGSIDAFAASEPTPSVAEQRGARQLVTLGGMGNEYPILLLADSTRLSQQADAMKRFLRALRWAEQYLTEHPEEAAALMAAESGLPLATTRQAMARHTYALRLDDSILASLRQTALFLKQQHIITDAPDWTRVFQPSFLQE